ncbi:MAG: endonuclease domain-containing protein [Flavobacteriaceae bacterium]|nr:endonuclease domain-containing protein [Flavobacteriaceae bacterium]
MKLPFYEKATGKIVDNAQANLKVMTAAETMLWQEIRKDKLGVRFRKQHPIDMYILDFYCHRKKMAIEVDSEIRNNPDAKEHDAERSKVLHSIGITILRLSNEEVLKNVKGGLERIGKWLAEN